MEVVSSRELIRSLSYERDQVYSLESSHVPSQRQQTAWSVQKKLRKQRQVASRVHVMLTCNAVLGDRVWAVQMYAPVSLSLVVCGLVDFEG